MRSGSLPPMRLATFASIGLFTVSGCGANVVFDPAADEGGGGAGSSSSDGGSVSNGGASATGGAPGTTVSSTTNSSTTSGTPTFCDDHDDCGVTAGEDVCIFSIGECARRCGPGSPPCPPSYFCKPCATSSCAGCRDCIDACVLSFE